jgi:hypothetical protein
VIELSAEDRFEPPSTKTSLGQRLSAHARANWPQLSRVGVRFRGRFAYIDGHFDDGETMPLCRLRCGGSASLWGFAIYRACDDYEDNFLPSGLMAGSPKSPRLRVLPLRHRSNHPGRRADHRRINDSAH